MRPDVARLIEHACWRQAAAVNLDLRDGIGDLRTIAYLAPFVGFLGNIIGILNSFKGVCGEKSAMLAALALDLSESNYATAFGLFVGISALLAHCYLRERADHFELEMRLAPGILLSRLKKQDGPWIASTEPRNITPPSAAYCGYRRRLIAVTVLLVLLGFFADLGVCLWRAYVPLDEVVQRAALAVAVWFAFFYAFGRTIWMRLLRRSHWELLAVTAALNLMRILTLLFRG